MNNFSLLSWAVYTTPAGDWFRNLAFQAALNRAYFRFANRYSNWVGDFFDQYFVQQTAKSLLARYLQPVDPPTPTELATLWAEQFPPDWAMEKHQPSLTPVAADFLSLLEAEMEQGFLLT